MDISNVDWYSEEFLFTFGVMADFYRYRRLVYHKLQDNSMAASRLLEFMGYYVSSQSETGNSSGFSSPDSSGGQSVRRQPTTGSTMSTDTSRSGDYRYASFMKQQIALRPPPRQLPIRLSFAEVVDESKFWSRALDGIYSHNSAEYQRRALKMLLNKTQCPNNEFDPTIEQVSPRLRSAPYLKPIPLGQRLRGFKSPNSPTGQ